MFTNIGSLLRSQRTWLCRVLRKEIFMIVAKKQIQKKLKMKMMMMMTTIVKRTRKINSKFINGTPKLQFRYDLLINSVLMINLVHYFCFQRDI